MFGFFSGLLDPVNGIAQSDLRLSQSAGSRHSITSLEAVAGEPRDLMAEIDDYIESINENFAAYSRESMNTPKRTLAAPGETPKSALKVTNKSFSEDSIVPSNHEAESLFGINADDVDFNDPHLTDKSLKDIGFNYSHNKYLSKSRNFVNQRKELTHVSPVCVQLAESKNDNEYTKHTDIGNRDSVDATLVNSALSSPYNSDSSLEKEIMDKKTPRSKALLRTRHTLLHSPTIIGNTDSLSTVDTDSHVLHHATPIRLSGSISAPVQTLYNSSGHVNSGDEVTFV